MRIVIGTPMWKRRRAFEIYAKNLVKTIAASDHEVIVWCAGSEQGESYELAKAYGFNYVEAMNTPHELKRNILMRNIANEKPDYVLMLGADDIISDGYIDTAISQNKDVTGPTDCYFYDLRTNEMLYWPGYINHRKGEPTGAGRLFRRDYLDRVKWMPWASGEYPDKSSWGKVVANSENYGSFSLRESGEYLVDFKDDASLSSFFDIKMNPDSEQMPDNWAKLKGWI